MYSHLSRRKLITDVWYLTEIDIANTKRLINIYLETPRELNPRLIGVDSWSWISRLRAP